MFDSTLVAGPFDTRTRPRIALAPDGQAELLYACSNAGQMTAWRCSMGEPRSYEMFASDLALTTYPQPCWALAPSGSPRATYFKPNGRFVCALREAEEQKIVGNAVTPFLLKRLAELTEGSSVRTNIALLKNNVAVAAEIAKALESGD